MNIPAPAPLGSTPTLGLRAPFGWIDPAQLSEATSLGRAPVILHRLGGEAARQARGPREFREETEQALDRAGWRHPWGLGAICRTTEEAAHFATAGYTWFTLDLAAHLEPRAATMSLEELDAAIVALEDRGCYPPAWHDRYLEEPPTLAVCFTDETLARVAVRFGTALAEAEQIVQAIRASASERGDLPDLEISVATAPLPSSPEDLVFLAAETLHRGLVHGGGTRFAPALGTWHDAGAIEVRDVPASLLQLGGVLPSAAILSVPERIGHAAEWTTAHWDASDESLLQRLRALATEAPETFREILVAAQAAFSTSRAHWHISTSEDDVRFLPQVPDAELVPTFLETTFGRQLLLVTWDDISDAFAGKLAPRS